MRDVQKSIDSNNTISLLVDCYPHNEASKSTVAIPQFHHRLKLLEHWNIAPGSNVLEIGCGQGECSLVLANAVGETGHITAVDPAPLDYGAPVTMQQARAHISASALGKRITFVISDPIDFFAAHPGSFDVVVICHFLWYFASMQSIEDFFRGLRAMAPRVCVAEYALAYSTPRQIPHVLAAEAQGRLWAGMSAKMRASRVPNVRTTVSPAELKAIFEKVGFQLSTELVVTPAPELCDGGWEVKLVLDEAFARDAEACLDKSGRERISALREKLKEHLLEIGGDGNTSRPWTCGCVLRIQSSSKSKESANGVRL